MLKRIFACIFFAGFSCCNASVFDKIKEVFSQKQVEKNHEEKFVSEKGTAISALHIAVVDMKEVAAKCKAGYGINVQLQKINDAAKARLLPLEEKVKKESERLKDDAIRAEEMQAALYDTVKTERYQISEAADQAIDALKNAMKRTIEKIARRDGLIVLDAEAVLSEHDVKNITQEVIDQLDKDCPEIEIKLRGEA